MPELTYAGTGITDRFTEITQATAELAEIQLKEEGELEAVRARYRPMVAAAKAKVEAAAAKLVVAPPSQTSTGRRVQAKLAFGEQPATGLPHIPPRRLRLLNLLDDAPNADYGYFASALYGRNDRSAKNGVAAEFSGLKEALLVEPIEDKRGMFRLTELGRRMLAANWVVAVGK